MEIAVGKLVSFLGSIQSIVFGRPHVISCSDENGLA